MHSVTSTFAVVAEDQYRRERAVREIHAGRSHHARFAPWRSRRRPAGTAGR